MKRGALLHRDLHWYGATMAVAASTLPLWCRGEMLLASFVLLASLASLLSTCRLLQAVERADRQRLHLDQQLLQSQKLASIGELSSGIAHEINNPLAIIGQEIEWVRHLLKEEAPRATEGSDELRDSLEEIARQVSRCREITHKLLDFARKSEPLIQGVDVNKLIEDMARLVEKEAVHKSIRIVREYSNELPPVRTDAPLLRQVVLNLLNNATQAIEKDGTATVATRASGPAEIEIVVSDTGCGIPKESLGKIFDPFFTTKPPGKGTGLGLSICHGVVARLGGRIAVKSEVGKGSAFTIFLPLEQTKGES